MAKNTNKLVINENDTLKYALKKMNSNGLKCLFVIDKDFILLGTLSDGDIRKTILKNNKLDVSIKKIYNKKPIVIYEKKSQTRSNLNKIINSEINVIPVISSNNKLIKYLKLREVKNYFKEISIPIIIMAGGKGSRLEPFTQVLPKPLVPLKGKPIIKIIIDLFIKKNINNFYISLNYKSDLLKTYLNDLSAKINIETIEEKKPLGTAGSLRLLPDFNHDQLLITNCDTIIKFDYAKMINFHIKNKNCITILSVKKNHRIPYGVINKNNNVLNKIVEKPNISIDINGGLYVINKDILKLIPINKKFNFDQLINKCLNLKRKIGIFSLEEKYWSDIGQWSEYKNTISKFNN